MECKWFKNLMGFAGNRPPFVIFTLCLALFAVELFAIGYYVQSQDFDPNQTSVSFCNTYYTSLNVQCLFVLMLFVLLHVFFTAMESIHKPSF